MTQELLLTMDRASAGVPESSRYRALNTRDLPEILERGGMPPDEILAVRSVAAVLPFRTNRHVLGLIDWDNVPEDPIYQLTVPQPGMLDTSDLKRMSRLLASDAPQGEIKAAAHDIRMSLNPHPSGQMTANIPMLDGEQLAGMQHKYPETVLFFPAQGQTCHAFCTYCFRWPQFVDEPELKMKSNKVDTLQEYVSNHSEVSDVLITGGDPMIMSADRMEGIVAPLLDIDHLESIRFGSKSLAFWPNRFVTDRDASQMLRLIERVRKAGKNFAFMAHFSHPKELAPDITKTAIRHLLGAGAIIRTQAPLINHVNNDPHVWSEMWKEQVRLGLIPYYMFVERDTGPRDYFEVPLAEAYGVFNEAYTSVSGLARTVRGPVMSAHPGKVQVDGIVDIAGEKTFAMHLVQARDPRLAGKPFFAKFDPNATWLTDLKPIDGTRFPFD